MNTALQQTTLEPVQSFTPVAIGILQRACTCGQHTSGSGECEECKRKRQGILQRAAVTGSRLSTDSRMLQTKLAINQPGDEYEQEADWIANGVMALTAHPRVCNAPSHIQRFGARSSEDKDAAPPSVDQALASPGSPLEPELRQNMEQRFGYDFSQVRVHSDSAAEESAREVNALAYTVGRDIVFGESQYAPTTRVGQKLIAHELTHVLQQGAANQAWGDNSSGSTMLPSHELVQRQPTSPPVSEDVWGLPITRSMCGCRQRIRDGIVWANTARATYAACDTPANPTSSDVEACFDAAHPGSSVVASTSPSGTITLPPPSADPCDRIENKASFVHEIMHSRHTDVIARAQGSAFFREWRRLAGDPDRLDKLRPTFPAQVAAFEARWEDGHDWAQDEVNSYRWERRFLEDALAALNRICQP